MFLKNRNISSEIKRSKVTDYAALNKIYISLLINVFRCRHVIHRISDRIMYFNENKLTPNGFKICQNMVVNKVPKLPLNFFKQFAKTFNQCLNTFLFRACAARARQVIFSTKIEPSRSRCFQDVLFDSILSTHC